MTVVSPLWTSLLPADATFEARDIAIRAHGHQVEYADGTVRLCATSGLWNAPLGYGDPSVAEAVNKAMRDASYLSLFRTPHRYAMDAADALVGLAGRDVYERVIFSTSGGAAIDAAMKLARQYWAQRGQPDRTLIVGLKGSYHGTMYGSHSLSGDDLLQSLYGLDRRTIRHVAHSDDGLQLDTVMSREGSRVAAVVIEPLLGSGAHVVSDEFLRRLLELREKHGFLLVADEVATGFGRTGPLFASGTWAKAPDLLVLSKALTNGAMGAAAILVGSRVASEYVRGGWTFVHGETQAGTPASAAAMLAVIAELERMDVETVVSRLGAELLRRAERLVTDGLAEKITGRGCFLGVTLAHSDGRGFAAAEVRHVVEATARRGAIVQPGPSGVALIPSYRFDDNDLDELEAALRGALHQVEESQG